MSGSTSVEMGFGGGDGYRPPFTAVQWQELEHQALIYKYLMAGVPVPSDLVMPIRRSLESLSARFLQHPTLGYCSYYGKKFDPEPGRCRRTDGKKWRCSKDAYQESKYCERHMHRGRNRSRKHVESQLTSAAVSNLGSQSLCPTNNDSGSFDFGSSVSKLKVESSPYGINNKDFRYDQSYVSGVARNDGMESNGEGKGRLIPSHDSYLVDGGGVSRHPLFEEWTKAREMWPDFSTTRLSTTPSDLNLNGA